MGPYDVALFFICKKNICRYTRMEHLICIVHMKERTGKKNSYFTGETILKHIEED